MTTTTSDAGATGPDRARVDRAVTIDAGELERQRPLLWGLCYRMTGSAAEADDLVQETFVRAMERPPAHGGPLRPWLVRVATNLARDALRRRKRRAYDGPWLPEALDENTIVDRDAQPVDARYGTLESVTFAFLVALETLTPAQRAVLLLRDVYGYDVGESAEMLAMSEVALRVAHHRARARLEAFDATRGVTPAAVSEATMKLVDALLRGDVAATAALFAPGIELHTDAGGAHRAARRVIRGADRVARGIVGIARRGASLVRATDLRTVNGALAVVVDAVQRDARDAPRTVLSVVVDREGRIVAIYSLLAPEKLRRIR